MNVRFTLLFFFSFFFLQLTAQDILKNIEKYSEQYQEERIYIHYDKTAYSPGETIWYKAYLMKTIYPEDESKTVYIDFTDENGKLLLHSSSAVLEGNAFGQFDLTPDYKGGFIYIKAYTKWMLNFDSAFLYHKEIKVLNKGSKLPARKVSNQITFFPEGGDIIEGVVNKVAFKMNDAFGRPIKAKGIIQNNSGKTIDSLRVLHDGMGYFYLNPFPGESFKVKWIADGDTEKTATIPPALKGGIGFQMGVLKDKRSFKISSPDYGDTRSLYVIGTMYQQQVFNFSRNLSEGVLQGVIPTADLPSGIITITVFDDNWKPQTERITYINNEEFLFTPEITVEHWGINKRARNEILVTVPDSLVANLSISVTDGDIAIDTSDNIISHLKLSSELKGKINNPAAYFKDNEDSTVKKLDLVMLTHGWRKFDWQQIAAGEMPEIIYPKDTSYLTISGKIFGASPIQLRSAGDIVLLFKQGTNGQNNIVNVPINSDGTFNDPNLIVFDTANIYYQLPKGKGLESATVQFMQERLPPLGKNMKATGEFYNYNTDTTGNSRQLQFSDIVNQEAAYLKAKVLETVTINRKTKSPVEIMDEKYTSGMFRGGDGFQFDLINDPFAASSMNIFTYLQGKVAGLQINSSSNPPTLTWRGGAPGIYLDEMQTDADMISSVSVSDVAYIKVIRPPFMGAMGGANGAIAIYTRRGSDMQNTTGGGLSKNTVTGYTGIRQFYVPNYSSFQPEHEQKDLRTTLYWNPEIRTSPGNNKVLLTFYNNDISEKFKIVLQGMTKDGRLANVVMEMQ